VSEINKLLAEQEEGNRFSTLAIGDKLRGMVATEGWAYLKKEIDDQVSAWRDSLETTIDFNESLMVRGMLKAYKSILTRVYSQIEDADFIKEEIEGVKKNG